MKISKTDRFDHNRPQKTVIIAIYKKKSVIRAFNNSASRFFFAGIRSINDQSESCLAPNSTIISQKRRRNRSTRCEQSRTRFVVAVRVDRIRHR